MGREWKTHKFVINVGGFLLSSCKIQALRIICRMVQKQKAITKQLKLGFTTY